MASDVGAITFDRADIALFAAASHDRNPLHVSDTYARRTPYGEPVVHGVLGVIAALGRAADRCELVLSHISMTFRHPLFVGLEYRVEVDQSADLTTQLRVFDGQRLMMNTRLNFIRALPHRRPAAVHTAARSEAVDRSLDAMKDGTEIGGVYAPSVLELERLIERWRASDKGVDDGAWVALLWCSYLVGMELPGKRALFWSADMRIEPQGYGAQLPFGYRARVLRSHAQLEYVDIEAELSAAESTVASARLRAFVRRDSPVSEPAALERLLPKSARLDGKLAVVIGGSRGLGAAIVQALAMQGCTVLATYRDSAADAERVRASVDGLPGTAEMVRGNAADEAWCRNVLRPLITHHGGLDILVCNASPPMRPLDLSLAKIQRLRAFVCASLDLVSMPVAALIEGLADRLGCCIFVSSSFVRLPPADWPHYVAAKSAAEGLISWAAANFKSVRFIIARPPKLLTDQTNTPAGRQGGLPVERAAAAIVRRLCDTSTSEPIEIIEAF